MKSALVYKSNQDQVVLHSVAGIAQITYDAVDHDDCGLWNASQNRFVIPAGVTKARLGAQTIWRYEGTPSPNNIRQTVIKKNVVAGQPDWYSGRPGWGVAQTPLHLATTVDQQCWTPWLSVVEGDDFMADCFQSSLSTAYIRATNGTWFAIEIA